MSKGRPVSSVLNVGGRKPSIWTRPKSKLFCCHPKMFSIWGNPTECFESRTCSIKTVELVRWSWIRTILEENQMEATDDVRTGFVLIKYFQYFTFFYDNRKVQSKRSFWHIAIYTSDHLLQELYLQICAWSTGNWTNQKKIIMGECEHHLRRGYCSQCISLTRSWPLRLLHTQTGGYRLLQLYCCCKKKACCGISTHNQTRSEKPSFRGSC